MRLINGVVAALALSALVALPASAQGYFGQNQVQYRSLKWRVLETEHFLIHYYPEERHAVVDAARMAERSYARLSRLLNHQFREKKPIILFDTRGAFGQNNVTGDLGEGTGGVTDALRHRNLLPFTGDWKSFEHVLTHEMVHQFQYDIFARGRAGGGLQALATVNPPLWLAEGMAEYLSVGPVNPNTAMVMRDASLNGHLPTIKQMTEDPYEYFPYTYGAALWAYIGARWGDEAVGEIMNAVPNVGVARAFKRELGVTLEELGDEWREATQTQHLPQVAERERPRKFSQPLLNAKRTGGNVFVAPSLSNDGKQIVFIATGRFLRGEVFPDLWLADATTGKRTKRLIKSTTNPNFEELRLLYSQSAFSLDGKWLAFTGYHEGRDVLYVMDMKKKKVSHKLDLPVDAAWSPTWSPDSKRIVFSGSVGGMTDLYVVDAANGANLRRLTNDRYGDLQPQWSPDGQKIAFASERGGNTDISVLRFDRWRIHVYDMATSVVTEVPGQAGLNLNPQWAPDGRSIAFVSNRTGIPNIYLYDFDAREHFQLTNVMGGVSAFTEYSPALTWARGADRLAYVYYEKGDFTVWSVSNPRNLKKAPFREPVIPAAVVAKTVAADSIIAEQRVASALASAVGVVGNGTRADSVAASASLDTTRKASIYRSGSVFRPSAIPGVRNAKLDGEAPVSVAAILDSATLALPDTTRFKDYAYRTGFQPEYISQPTVGYSPDNFGRGVYGGTTIVLADLLGNSRLAVSGAINGRISEAQVFVGYTNLAKRLQWTTGAMQLPYYFFQGIEYAPIDGNPNRQLEQQNIGRFMIRQAFAAALYPTNRFTRFEFGAQFNNLEQSVWHIRRVIDVSSGLASEFFDGGTEKLSRLNYAAPYVAYVSDNTLMGYTGPIFGRRYRFQVEPTIGSLRWIEYSADYRRYDALLFNFLTIASRAQTAVAVGRDEMSFPKYIGRPNYVRGYDRQNGFSYGCNPGLGSSVGCTAAQLLGSRIALTNVELRFPLIRRLDLGILPISLPPLEGLVFYDAGVAWSKDQQVHFRRPNQPFNTANDRFLLTSYGFGLRLNLFGIALIRWDFTKPLDSLNPDGSRNTKGFWVWTLGPSF